ncbi:MAG: hypothetical protein MRJ63_14735 [Nitrospirales bacterium]|nr:hypothetical protein [Nitrospirales bacterium]
MSGTETRSHGLWFPTKPE